MQSPKPFSQLIPLKHSNSPVPLPTPPGPYKVGTLSLEAIDTSRLDPYAPTPQNRRLMLSFFYPTSDDNRPFAAYFSSPKIAADCDECDHLPYGTTARYQPQAYDHTQVKSGPLPIILFSPGFGVYRESYTIVLENLASEGYFCVSIGHTYDTTIHFPDGEVVWQIGWLGMEPDLATRVRAQDAAFALDQLSNATFMAQIHGLGHRTLDVSRVGMFGHSIGGAAALEAMGLDARIVGGVNLDGAFQGNQMAVGTDRPFLVINAPKEVTDKDPSFAKTWPHLTGWKAALEISGAVHMSFADYGTCYKLLGVLDAMDPNKKQFGTVDPLRMMAVQSIYLKAFFDFVLREGSDHVFRYPDQAFPEVTIVDGTQS
jgi:pimeloyl-ACP methyl ester carboxylesterase